MGFGQNLGYYLNDKSSTTHLDIDNQLCILMFVIIFNYL